MSYLTRRRKAAAATDGGSCKKHPKHRQSPGVCSVCLKEKLSQLQFPTSPSVLRIVVESSSSCSSDLSSSCSESSYSSPVLHHQYRFRNDNNTNYVLTKSKSLAFVPRIKEMMISSSNGDGESRGAGLSWFNLLRPRHRGMRMEHSRTVREGVTVIG